MLKLREIYEELFYKLQFPDKSKKIYLENLSHLK